MKKQTLLFFILFCTIQFSFAQQFRTESIRVNYFNLPDEPLPSSVKTYSTSLESSGTNLSFLGERKDEFLNDYLQISSKDRVDNLGDIEIKINVGKIITHPAKNSTNKESLQSIKEVNIDIPIQYSVEHKKGKILDQGIISEQFTFEFSTTNSSELNTEWNKVKSIYTDRKILQHLSHKMEELTTLLQHKYDYKIENATFPIQMLFEHDASKTYNQHIISALKIFYSTKAESNISKARKLLEPSLLYWGKLIQNSDTEKSIINATHSNLAFIHYWLDNLDEAQKFANLAYKNDDTNSEIIDLIQNISHTRKEFKLNNTNSRHGLPQN